MSWLDEHFDTFVIPYLYELDHSYKIPFKPKDAREYVKASSYFQPEELTVIKNVWRSIKRAADGKTILLPGRDVFVFEILARRENYPTVFIPECSRMTVRKIAGKVDPELFLFDTGFAGSIPKGLGTQNFQLLSYHIFGENFKDVQVFPRLSLSRHLALRIEETPKYWESGRLGMDDKIIQPISSYYNFIQAAELTVEVYTNSAPKFIKRHRPIERTMWRW